MTWLVTGGVGYIGAHVVRAFLAEGIEPVVLDDLSSGHREFVPDGVTFVEGQVQDTQLLRETMRDLDVEGVMHIAGYKYAGVSVTKPLHTYSQNVQGTASVLEAMNDAGVHKIVFSSSAAVYSTPDVDLVTEGCELHPESPYGESKLIGEWLIADEAKALSMTEGRELQPVYNLGSGDGLSVRQIMDAMLRGTGHSFEPVIGERRAGDPARIVADGSAAARDIDWRMRHDIDQMVTSAWQARTSH